MVKECVVILSNLTEYQSKILAENLKIQQKHSIKCLTAHKTDKVLPMIEIIRDEDLNRESVVNVDGILLPLYDKDNVQSGNLVPVKSTLNNLRSLALAVASGKNTSYNFFTLS